MKIKSEMTIIILLLYFYCIKIGKNEPTIAPILIKPDTRDSKVDCPFKS